MQRLEPYPSARLSSRSTNSSCDLLPVRRLEEDWQGVSASILEGLDEMLTVTRLGLAPELRRSLPCTNMIKNVMGALRRACRNVKYWRSPSMALRWAGAAMQEAAKVFRRLKAQSSCRS
jgi:putative transposase